MSSCGLSAWFLRIWLTAAAWYRTIPVHFRNEGTSIIYIYLNVLLFLIFPNNCMLLCSPWWKDSQCRKAREDSLRQAVPQTCVLPGPPFSTARRRFAAQQVYDIQRIYVESTLLSNELLMIDVTSTSLTEMDLTPGSQISITLPPDQIRVYPCDWSLPFQKYQTSKIS